MRYFLLWLAMIFSAGAAAADTSGLRAFYCIHAERSCKETKALVAVSARDAKALAQRALATKDDFVGFVDAQDTTLQFYVESADSILVDMPAPTMQGSYATHMTRAQAEKLIARLAPPLSRYRNQLKLVFAKWQ
jgi:hypothetical protein